MEKSPCTITIPVCETCVDLHRLPDEGIEFDDELRMCACCQEFCRPLYAVKVSVPPHRGAAA